MKEYFEQLGDRIKLYFQKKSIEDKEQSELTQKAIFELTKAQKEKEKEEKETQKKLIESVKKLERTLYEKELSVNIEAPIVNVPEPKIEIVKETEHASKANEILNNLLLASLKQLENQGYTKITNSQPSEAIPVRLTDRSGKKFYDAMFQALSSGAGYPFKLPSGESARANLDADGNIVVQLDMSEVSVNNFPAFGLESTQQLVLSVLQSILNLDFATETSQANIITILNEIENKDFATSLKQDEILSILGESRDYLTDIYAQLVAIYNRQNEIITAINSDPALNASAPTQATVGVVSIQILPANPNRKGLTITNLSTKDVFLSFNGWGAIVNSGVPLSANGGTYNMDRFDKTTGVVKAIAQQAGSILAIQEYT